MVEAGDASDLIQQTAVAADCAFELSLDRFGKITRPPTREDLLAFQADWEAMAIECVANAEVADPPMLDSATGNVVPDVAAIMASDPEASDTIGECLEANGFERPDIGDHEHGPETHTHD